MKNTRNQYFEVRDGQEYKVELYYSKGGFNYFTGNENKRGFHISVTPVTRQYYEDGELYSTSSMMFQGIKHLVKEVKRFSQAQYDKIYADGDWWIHYAYEIEQLIKYCQSKGWTTEPAEPMKRFVSRYATSNV